MVCEEVGGGVESQVRWGGGAVKLCVGVAVGFFEWGRIERLKTLLKSRLDEMSSRFFFH